jgi:hypothetical protein
LRENASGGEAHREDQRGHGERVAAIRKSHYHNPFQLGQAPEMASGLPNAPIYNGFKVSRFV